VKRELKSVILFLIDQTSKQSKRYSQREFDERGLDMTIDQWVLLKIIEENQGISQKELADKSLRDGASITRTLDILEKKSLISRHPIPENRRQYSVALTDKGAQFIAENMDMVYRHRAKSLEGFTRDEIDELKEMLLRIQDNMK